MKLKLPFSDKNLHWTTVTSEKVLLAIIGIATCIAAAQYLFQMYEAREILLADLFLLFIYVEIIGMVGAFYSTNRIPVTLPIIIAITALCRLIIMQGKEMDALSPTRVLPIWRRGPPQTLRSSTPLSTAPSPTSCARRVQNLPRRRHTRTRRSADGPRA